jgi:O-methyltransferase
MLDSLRPVFNHFVKRSFANFGYEIHRSRELALEMADAIERARPMRNPICLHDQDEHFNQLWEQIRGHTLVDKDRCFVIYQLTQQAARLPGDVAEVGVYKGGTAKLLGKQFINAGKTVHLFDTFAGMPPTDPRRDWHKENDFNDTSLESVTAYLNDCTNTLLYPGLFPCSAASVQDRDFCLVHIDVDIYKSVMDCIEFFYPRLLFGGIAIFDDYGFLTCPGAKEAVDEFFADKAERPFYLPTGQCLVIKIEKSGT